MLAESNAKVAGKTHVVQPLAAVQRVDAAPTAGQLPNDVLIVLQRTPGHAFKVLRNECRFLALWHGNSLLTI
jgi:hypothetical protein